jgi:hypothetical protein
MIEIIATALSLFGAAFVASSKSQHRSYGFGVWIISNVIWVIYFSITSQFWPALLFFVYLILAIYGLFNNVKEYYFEY